MPKLLLVEDDPRIESFVRRGLEAEGHVVDHADDLPVAAALVRATEYDLLIVDRMLPGGDGLGILGVLRLERRRVPVLLLTARDSLADKVEGLRGGADDYMTKPFAFDELVARVDTLLRRGQGEVAEDPVLRLADLELDPVARRVRRGEREVELTAKEFALLAYLMRNPGRAISRTRLLANVWEYSFDPETKVVDVYIRYLRRKIDEGEARPLLHTVRGFGYRLSEEAPVTSVKDGSNT